MASSPFIHLNRSLITAFGAPVPAVHYPSAGGGPLQIAGILDDPPMLEGVMPGTVGNVALRFFVNVADVLVLPRNGDRIVVNTVSYDVSGDPAVDTGGGCTISLRANA